MKVGIGQDSHVFDFDNKDKELILGGVIFENETPLKGNSDADAVLHAITNAISSITCVNIIGKIADDMCKNGITDSVTYLQEALKYMGEKKIVHVAITIECKTPKITPKIQEMRERIAELLNISDNSVGITATTGEGLTECGRGNGISVLCVITVEG